MDKAGSQWLRRVQRRFEAFHQECQSSLHSSVSSCSSLPPARVPAQFCKEVCRGQIRRLANSGAEDVVGEDEAAELSCCLLGLKPLCLLSSGTRGPLSLLRDGRSARVMFPYEGSDKGPVLVSSIGEEHRAQAAVPALIKIGAWKQDSLRKSLLAFSKEEGQGLSERQSHVLLGLLLGYPVQDVFALHRSLCSVEASASKSSCDFQSDFMAVMEHLEAKHLVRIQLEPMDGATDHKISQSCNY